MLQGSEGLHPFPCSVVISHVRIALPDSTPSGRPDALRRQLLGFQRRSLPVLQCCVADAATGDGIHGCCRHCKLAAK